MRRSTLLAWAVLTVGISGCDKVRPVVDPMIVKIQVLIDKVRGRQPPPRVAQRPDTTRRDTTAAAPARMTGPGRQAAQRPATRTSTPAPPPSLSQGSSGTLRDEPYVSRDTGTIAPGMKEEQIYALWGAPAAVRRSGDYTYLFFRNGCEYTCGTMDIVTLENDQVVDAVLRWPGHQYSGQSSSPRGTKPHPNPGGDTLVVPRPDTSSIDDRQTQP
jgi:hypothetical protein